MKLFWMALAGIAAALAFAALAVITLDPAGIRERVLDWAQSPDLQDGPQVVLAVAPDGVALDQAIEESIKIIDRRLNDLGARRVVQRQDADRILVQLSRSANVKRLIEVSTRRGKLEFRLVDQPKTMMEVVQGESSVGAEELFGRADKAPRLVEKRVLLTGRDLADARSAFDQRTNEPIVTFRFNADGARKFAQVTQENVGRAFAIVFDGEILSAPIIREPILGGSGQISGNFTVDDANELAILLRAGELPARLTVIEER